MPKKIYCVHITKLSPSIDAEKLSEIFRWNIRSIIMNPCSNGQLSTIECWLKHIDDKQIAEDFVENYGKEMIHGSRIECVIEEDRFEFCKNYRVGKCTMSNEECDWEHVICTANGKCSNDCRFGHKEGTKSGYYNESTPGDTYRIKITGFQSKLTKQALISMLNEKNCFVDDQQTNVGYIGYIKTLKYAQRLIKKWHNKEIDGQKLKCQIELNTRYASSKTLPRSGSLANLQLRNSDSSDFDRHRQQSNNNSRNTSPVRGNSDPDLRTADEQEFSYETKAYKTSLNNISNQNKDYQKRKTISRENLGSSEQLTSENHRKTSRLRNKNDSNNFAVLIEYESVAEQAYNKELTALKLLKGKNVNGIVQRIDLSGKFGIKEREADNKKHLCILTEEPTGYTLEYFIKNIHRGGFRVLEAIQLVQILTKIVKEIHSKGVFHQYIEPENIFISWDDKQKSADEAKLTLVNFSEAYILSEKDNRIEQTRENYWYQAPQLRDEIMKYSSTVDASNLCAILFWLLTNVIPQHEEDHLPHQNEKVKENLYNKIAQAVRESNSYRKLPIEETQVKTYLFDTFNIAFGYPHHQPWTISDFECRLESIRELLLPRDRELNTTDAIINKLISMNKSGASSSPKAGTSSSSNIFEKAANAFQQAKQEFIDVNKDYSWSDGGCIWLDSAQTCMNERRHDDILIYERHERRQLLTYSLIITSFASVSADCDCITLSIGSTVNGKMSRIPIGCYSKAQNYTGEFRKNFTTELNRLLISIAKARQAMLQ